MYCHQSQPFSHRPRSHISAVGNALDESLQAITTLTIVWVAGTGQFRQGEPLDAAPEVRHQQSVGVVKMLRHERHSPINGQMVGIAFQRGHYMHRRCSACRSVTHENVKSRRIATRPVAAWVARVASYRKKS